MSSTLIKLNYLKNNNIIILYYYDLIIYYYNLKNIKSSIDLIFKNYNINDNIYKLLYKLFILISHNIRLCDNINVKSLYYRLNYHLNWYFQNTNN